MLPLYQHQFFVKEYTHILLIYSLQSNITLSSIAVKDIFVVDGYCIMQYETFCVNGYGIRYSAVDGYHIMKDIMRRKDFI